MKKYLVFVALAALILSSCKSEETKVTDVVEDFFEALNAKNSEKMEEIYPKMRMGKVKFDEIEKKELTVTKENENRYKVSFKPARCVYVEKSEGKYKIVDSRNFLESHIVGEWLLAGIAEKTGMIKGDDRDTDVQRLEAFVQLSIPGGFGDYLLEKHEEAQNRGLKILSIKKEYVNGLLFAKVVFESEFSSVFKITLTACDENGKGIAKKSQSTRYIEQGFRGDLTFLFDTETTGKISKLDVEYEFEEGYNPYFMLLNFGKFSKNEYKEYLKNKEKK